MSSIDTFELGIGTWYPDQREQCVESVRTALDLGYRHVDTAQQYETEQYVGEAIERSDVPREEIFVATKVSARNLAYDRVVETAKVSLNALGVDTIDMLYVHYPLKAYDAEETMAAFADLADQGLVNHVGLSNYSIDLIEEAMDVLDDGIFAHQVEMHPLLHQDHLLEHAQEHGYWLVAYRPLVGGDVFDVDPLVQTAEKYDASPAQVSLAWLLSKDRVATIPKATGEHIRANWEAREIDLSEEDVEKIDAISREKRTVTRESSLMIDDESMPWEDE